MFCSKCGKEVQEDNAYCPSCGAKLAEEANKKQAKTNYGFVSMILGILSLVVSGVVAGMPLGIIAVVLSNKGEKNTYSLAGKITGIIGIVLSAVVLAYYIWCYICLFRFGI